MLPKNLTSFIWHFLKPNRLILSILFIVALLWSIELSLTPYFYKLIIDGVNQQTKPLLAAVLVPAILYVFISAFMNLTFRIYDYVNIILYQRLYTKITTGMFDYTSQHAYRYFQQHFSGSIANKILYLPRDIEPILRAIHEQFVPRAFAVLTACGMLLIVKPIFSIILLIWVTLFISATAWLARHASLHSKHFSEAANELNGRMVDSISNIITAKIFANRHYESRRIHSTQEKINKKYKTMQLYNLKLHAIQGIGITLLTAAMVTALIYNRLYHHISVGDFVFVLSLSSSIIMAVWNVGQELVNFTRNIGSCQQALSLINTPHEIKEDHNAAEINVTRGMLRFNQVTFAYTPGKPIFSDLSITIPAGQKVGLVGFSGGGKSSFVNIILRLFDIQSGQICIDQQNIKHVTLDSLRKNIAMIPQEPELFHRTLLENIRYGRLNASKEDVIAAAKKAHCHDFIEQLDEGYESLVGERGIKLSGGQRQRIAIARAILKQAPILILDEATSALDSVTEKLIQKSLHETMQGKTTLVIAHRLSTLLDMDRILFFKDGNIIEEGPLDQLLAQQGPFSRLWNMQCGGYLPTDSPIPSPI